MAYTFIWPVTLPQKPRTDYSETKGVIVLRTSMDAGPAKMRRRGKRTDTMQVSYALSTAQVAILDAFITDSLKGTIRFGFPHPRTGAVIEVRIVPQQDGAMFSLGYILPELYSVSLELEVLP
jgi:hypothetical protein